MSISRNTQPSARLSIFLLFVVVHPVTTYLGAANNLFSSCQKKQHIDKKGGEESKRERRADRKDGDKLDEQCLHNKKH